MSARPEAAHRHRHRQRHTSTLADAPRATSAAPGSSNASTPAAMAASRQRAAVSANKKKNWRANYLRALNIFAPDVRVPTPTRTRTTPENGVPSRRATRAARPDTVAAPVAAPSSSSRRRTRGDDTVRAAASSTSSRGRSSTSVTSARATSSRSGSSRSHSRPRGASPDDKASTYVFGLRSNLFRARRPTPRSEFMVVDRVSAPIEIPTSSSVTSPAAIPTGKRASGRDSMGRQRDNSNSSFTVDASGSKQPTVQLLSWEEPSVMLGQGAWPLESAKRSGGLSAWRSGGLGQDRELRRGIEEDCDETEDEDVDARDTEEDGIFKMEFDGESDSNDSKQQVFSVERRERARERREREREWEREDEEDADEMRALPESFVPPHQMVERDCFSLGLRDEFKRKPAVRI